MLFLELSSVLLPLISLGSGMFLYLNSSASLPGLASAAPAPAARAIRHSGLHFRHSRESGNPDSVFSAPDFTWIPVGCHSGPPQRVNSSGNPGLVYLDTGFRRYDVWTPVFTGVTAGQAYDPSPALAFTPWTLNFAEPSITTTGSSEPTQLIEPFALARGSRAPPGEVAP